MSSTLTARLGLVKPTPGTTEPVNLATQINANYDKIDAAAGFLICTSSTRPTGADRWDGRGIKETDTGKCYVWHAATSTWIQLLVSGANFDNALTVAEIIRSDRANATDVGFRTQLSGVGQHDVRIDGMHVWNADTNLYRAAANTLKTDDSFQVGGDLAVTGIGQEQFVRISGSNETRVSTTTFSSSALALPVIGTASATYVGELGLWMSSAANAAGDAQFRFTGPTAINISWGIHALVNSLASGSSASLEAQSFANDGTPTNATSVGLSTTVTFILIKFTIRAMTAAGNFTLQWTQLSSNASASTLAIGSYMTMKRVA